MDPVWVVADRECVGDVSELKLLRIQMEIKTRSRTRGHWSTLKVIIPMFNEEYKATQDVSKGHITYCILIRRHILHWLDNLFLLSPVKTTTECIFINYVQKSPGLHIQYKGQQNA